MSKLLDATLSVEIAKRIESNEVNSFDNAYHAALATPGSLYVQGFLVFSGKPYKPIEHSWIELDNSIVDPTLPYLHKKPEELYYFPAQKLTVKQLQAALEEAKEDYPEDEPLPVYGSMPYEYYGDVMLGGKEYQEAYEQAEAKCSELNKPKIK
ncbi:hypothetical protein H6S82_14210 [Planktothrix sp. FACHB-1355]|uniref:Uncharacterized protein n=1 Tax=Aerosakkonema funiforme FACHB-1375 TaxID=2949571 RepID=A0A926VIS6_9CYAN|nr:MULTISPECIES: hypothetical protein [Oscillatoriales]MBD2184622.1 hypothetical protein [Aerosakkonema funiforme FACHB-1375]MBD3560004.1 hypothetical protein [Planktothrix sp. FACHB-1355]